MAVVKVPQKIICCNPSQICLKFLEKAVLLDPEEDSFIPSWKLFVQHGQSAGGWVASVWPNKCSSPAFPAMMRKGYLIEFRVRGGWLYGLTEKGVERLLHHQKKYHEDQDRVDQALTQATSGGATSFLRQLVSPLRIFSLQEEQQAA